MQVTCKWPATRQTQGVFLLFFFKPQQHWKLKWDTSQSFVIVLLFKHCHTQNNIHLVLWKRHKSQKVELCKNPHRDSSHWVMWKVCVILNTYVCCKHTHTHTHKHKMCTLYASSNMQKHHTPVYPLVCRQHTQKQSTQQVKSKHKDTT